MTQSTSEEPYYGDLEKTSQLAGLFTILHDQRDDAWLESFFEHVADASFATGDPQVIHGPDGFPYFQLFIPEAGKPFTCFVIRHLIRDYLLANGLGIVIHPEKPVPEYVFTLGDLANFQMRNEFITTPEFVLTAGEEKVKAEEKVMLAQPSESFFPTPIRQALRSYLTWVKIENVKCLLLIRNTDKGVTQELAFNLTEDHFPDAESYQRIVQNIAWFLPRHYTYVTIDESTFPSHFQPL